MALNRLRFNQYDSFAVLHPLRYAFESISSTNLCIRCCLERRKNSITKVKKKKKRSRSSDNKKITTLIWFSISFGGPFFFLLHVRGRNSKHEHINYEYKKHARAFQILFNGNIGCGFRNEKNFTIYMKIQVPGQRFQQVFLPIPQFLAFFFTYFMVVKLE